MHRDTRYEIRDTDMRYHIYHLSFFSLVHKHVPPDPTRISYTVRVYMCSCVCVCLYLCLCVCVYSRKRGVHHHHQPHSSRIKKYYNIMRESFLPFPSSYFLSIISFLSFSNRIGSTLFIYLFVCFFVSRPFNHLNIF